jgi:hypothetical protein
MGGKKRSKGERRYDSKDSGKDLFKDLLTWKRILQKGRWLAGNLQDRERIRVI